jgi:hypothetical protein
MEILFQFNFCHSTGIYTWDTDSYTKLTYAEPWKQPLMIDWVASHSNGSYTHYAEPNHSTEVISTLAQQVIREHAAAGPAEARPPLFLYLPFTAAHSPLQPLPRHEEKCAHIRHLWRRQFCGMVVGLDEAVQNVTETALAELGSDLLLLVTSDNGGLTLTLTLSLTLTLTLSLTLTLTLSLTLTLTLSLTLTSNLTLSLTLTLTLTLSLTLTLTLTLSLP